MRQQRRIIIIVAVLLVAALIRYLDQPPTTGDESALLQAIAAQQSDIQVRGSGTVIKVLPTDNRGSRHQRFLINVSGNKILIAHNIDLAAPINNLKRGDIVEFNGEFEWNDKGGVIHWTHHDPAGRHEDGWLKHDGKLYQ